MGLDHPLDGVTNPKYNLLHLLSTKKICKEKKALAFNQDRCCHLALCLQLILFHWGPSEALQIVASLIDGSGVVNNSPREYL